MANAVEALRHVLANHKKTSLFGFAWKYINLWSAIKHRLFHKNELPDYEKIIVRKAVFKSLTLFFQEMVLDLLCKLQKPDELTFIRNCTPLIRESIARNLRKCTFEQLESLKDNALTFLEKFFKDTNTTVSDNLRDIGMRSLPWDWGIFHKNYWIICKWTDCSVWHSRSSYAEGIFGWHSGPDFFTTFGGICYRVVYKGTSFSLSQTDS